MPRKRCTKNGKPGWKYGDSGHCYTYTKGDKDSEGLAIKRAEIQGSRIRHSQERRGEKPT